MSEMATDERALREHIASATFAEGRARGEWRLIGDIEWPHALIAVRAAPRPGTPCEFVLRFDLAGYPVEAPAATLWDTSSDSVLPDDARPKGGRAGERTDRDPWFVGLGSSQLEMPGILFRTFVLVPYGGFVITQSNCLKSPSLTKWRADSFVKSAAWCNELSWTILLRPSRR